jgi:hypothetical protein
MGAGHSWRKLNGDQGDRRANKLPDISVRVHQAHDITGLSTLASLASTMANVWCRVFHLSVAFRPAMVHAARSTDRRPDTVYIHSRR